jgi:hypothetical protein
MLSKSAKLEEVFETLNHKLNRVWSERFTAEKHDILMQDET